MSYHPLLLLCLTSLHTLTFVIGHGMITCPVGRSYISWDTILLELVPKDKPDMPKFQNAINCGNRPGSWVGIHQQDFPATKLCGPCGDQIPLATGPVHEYEGIYDRGIIAGRFVQGSIATFTVVLDNPHWGYMEFRLCSDVTRESQACLNRNLLEIMNPSPGSNGSFQYYVDIGDRPRCSWDPTNQGCSMSKTYNIQVKLPDNVSTKRGVIQWNYVTGRLGSVNGDFECKRPKCEEWEVFRGCADVRIDPYTTLLKTDYPAAKDLCLTTTGNGDHLTLIPCNPSYTSQMIVPRQDWEDYKNRPFYIGFSDSGCAKMCMDVFGEALVANVDIGSYSCKKGIDRELTKQNQIWKIVPVSKRRFGNWENDSGKFTEDDTFLLQQGSKLANNLCASVYEKVPGLLRVRLTTCDPDSPSQRWTLAKYPVESIPNLKK